MEVIIDKEAGFCFGVKRSVDLVYSINNEKKVQILGELIHNKDFINDLDKRGVKTVDNPEDLSADVVIIRAHGIPREIESGLRDKFEVIDATCPYVKKIQTAAEKYYQAGSKIILLGEEKHPEVVGILSYAPGAIVVSGPRDLPKLSKNDNILFISQTTQNKKLFKDLSKKLSEEYENVVTIDTICDATTKKQQSAEDLAKQVDVMIVVGGKNSCNTKNLYKISASHSTAYHIENETEIDPSWFEQNMRVGITAGASTPEYIIKMVYNKLSSMHIKTESGAVC